MIGYAYDPGLFNATPERDELLEKKIRLFNREVSVRDLALLRRELVDALGFLYGVERPFDELAAQVSELALPVREAVSLTIGLVDVLLARMKATASELDARDLWRRVVAAEPYAPSGKVLVFAQGEIELTPEGDLDPDWLEKNRGRIFIIEGVGE